MKYPRLLFELNDFGLSIKMEKVSENEYKITSNVELEKHPDVLEIIKQILELKLQGEKMLNDILSQKKLFKEE